MNISAQIECDSKEELLTHLLVITSAVKRLKDKDFEVQDIIEIVDNNCYGCHLVNITDFK